MSALSREQLEASCREYERLLEQKRATIEQQAQEIEGLTVELLAARAGCDAWGNQVAKDREALAAMTTERDAWHQEYMTANSQAHTAAAQLATAQARLDKYDHWTPEHTIEEWLADRHRIVDAKHVEADTQLQATLAKREEELEAYAWTISPAMAQAKIDGQNQQLAKAALYIQHLQATLAAREARIQETEEFAEKELTPFTTLDEAKRIIKELQCSRFHRLVAYRERDAAVQEAERLRARIRELNLDLELEA